jgi:hypothetical protein
MAPPTATEQLIRDYLNRLSVAARDLAPEDRRALLERIRRHIEQKADMARRPSTMDVGRVIARLGEPAALAQQERRRLATLGKASPRPASAAPGRQRFLARTRARDQARPRGTGFPWSAPRDNGRSASPAPSNGVAGDIHPPPTPAAHESRDTTAAPGEVAAVPGGQAASPPTPGNAPASGAVPADRPVRGGGPAATGGTSPTGRSARTKGAVAADASARDDRSEAADEPSPADRPVTADKASPTDRPVPATRPETGSAESSGNGTVHALPVRTQRDRQRPVVDARPAGHDSGGYGQPASTAPLAVGPEGARRDAAAPAGSAASGTRRADRGKAAAGAAAPTAMRSAAAGRRWPPVDLAGPAGAVRRQVARLLARVRRRPLEAAAVVLMGIGGAIFPPVFLIGATLALASDLWDGRDKWIGIALPIVLTVIGFAVGIAAGGRAHWQHESWVYLDIVSRIAPALGAAYLAWRTERPRRPPTVPPFSRPGRAS